MSHTLQWINLVPPFPFPAPGSRFEGLELSENSLNPVAVRVSVMLIVCMRMRVSVRVPVPACVHLDSILPCLLLGRLGLGRVVCRVRVCMPCVRVC